MGQQDNLLTLGVPLHEVPPAQTEGREVSEIMTAMIVGMVGGIWIVSVACLAILETIKNLLGEILDKLKRRAK